MLSKFVTTSDNTRLLLVFTASSPSHSTVSSASATTRLFSTSSTKRTPFPATTGTAVTGPLTACGLIAMLVASCDAVDADYLVYAMVISI